MSPFSGQQEYRISVLAMLQDFCGLDARTRQISATELQFHSCLSLEINNAPSLESQISQITLC
jgi:hypothetical protein